MRRKERCSITSARRVSVAARSSFAEGGLPKVGGCLFFHSTLFHLSDRRMASRTLLRRADGICKNAPGLIRLISSKSTEVKETQKHETSKCKNLEEAMLTPLELEDRKLRNVPILVPIDEDVGWVSGVPQEHIKTRTVRIYQPAKSATQSGTDNINFWQIDFDTRERWENPLMGWTSTGDPMSNVSVDFVTKEEAIAHCEKMGWSYYVQKPNVNRPKPRTYGMNFSWNKRTRVSTK